MPTPQQEGVPTGWTLGLTVQADGFVGSIVGCDVEAAFFDGVRVSRAAGNSLSPLAILLVHLHDS